LEYSSKIATVFKVIKDLATKQKIKDTYLKDTGAQHAKTEQQEANKDKLMFVLDKTRLIRYKGVVYLLKRIRKEFTKELHKELITRHLRIEKTRDTVVACYYFLFIKKIVKQVVKECDICQKAKALRKHLYKLLKLLDTPSEP
jgi:hypothetical protein